MLKIAVAFLLLIGTLFSVGEVYQLAIDSPGVTSDKSWSAPTVYGSGKISWNDKVSSNVTYSLSNNLPGRYALYIQNVTRMSANAKWDICAAVICKVSNAIVTNYLNQKWAVLAATRAAALAVTSGPANSTDEVADYIWIYLGSYNLTMDGSEYVKLQSSTFSPKYTMAAGVKYINVSGINLSNYIINNEDLGSYSESGSWLASSLKGYNNSSTKYTGSDTAYAVWTPAFLSPGYYKIYVYTPPTTANQNAEYRVVHKNETNTVFLNQTLTNGFAPIGIYEFSGNGNEYVKVLGRAGANTRVDAVKFSIIDSASSLDALSIASAKINFSTVDANNLETNLTLPSSTFPNTFINWSSDKPSVISATGVLQSVVQDETVVLTAFITNTNSQSLTKKFTFQIKYSYELAINTNNVITENCTTAVTAGKLEFTTILGPNSYPSIRVKPATGSWNLGNTEWLRVTYKNNGSGSVTLSTWAVSDGWGGVGGFGGTGASGTTTITIAAGETLSQSVPVHAKYPDNSYKMIDPKNINTLHVVAIGSTPVNSKITILSVKAVGNFTDTYSDVGRLVVPTMTDLAPAAGRRVKMTMSGNLYYALYLPTDWVAGKKYPVIVEFPGNIFYNSQCYSTGRPEDVVMGYGVSKGEGYIWISMPLISTNNSDIQPNAWGSLTNTKQRTIQAIRQVISSYGGDPAGVFISGFSRGAISTGYIGLMDDEMADVWIGFHATQHTDGSDWNGAKIGFTNRGTRVNGRATMIVDNGGYPWATLMPYLGNPLLKLSSGIGCHSPANSLDDRSSSIQERAWYVQTYENKPGTYKIVANIKNGNDETVPGVLVETGVTHFQTSDSSGSLELAGLIKGVRQIRFSTNGVTIKQIQFTNTNLSNFLLSFNISTKEHSFTFLTNNLTIDPKTNFIVSVTPDTARQIGGGERFFTTDGTPLYLAMPNGGIDVRDVNFLVFDSSGRMFFRFNKNNPGKYIEWDGKDLSGEIPAQGLYVVKLTVTKNNGNVDEKNYMMVLLPN